MGMVLAAMILATVLACLPAFADGDYTAPPVTPPPEVVSQPPMSADQLDDLLSPIALYPDPLLAQILPAAAEPDDIAAATAWIAAGNDPNQIDDQPWDPSVQAIARYPSVLQMLAGYPDWTTEVGNAFATQQADVAASIQRLRAQATSAGSLVNTQQQTVVTDDDGIQIVPTDPQYVYVPVYDPQVVYVAPPPGIVANARITFGPPLATGIWLDNGWSWRGGYIVVGGGWRYCAGRMGADLQPPWGLAAVSIWISARVGREAASLASASGPSSVSSADTAANYSRPAESESSVARWWRAGRWRARDAPSSE